MTKYILKLLKTVLGLFIFAFGDYMMVQANIGLAPWDAFAQGIANITGASFGTAVVLVGLAILVTDLLLKEKIGLGTVLNTLLIGSFINFFDLLHIIPKAENFYWGLLLLIVGQCTLCFGTYVYIGTELGGGPRDSLMVGMGKRLKKLPIGAVRGGIEALVLLLGWLMGAKVGLGTAIAALTIGPTLQIMFKLLKFDIKALHHESLLGSYKHVRQLLAPKSAPDTSTREDA